MPLYLEHLASTLHLSARLILI